MAMNARRTGGRRLFSCFRWSRSHTTSPTPVARRVSIKDDTQKSSDTRKPAHNQSRSVSPSSQRHGTVLRSQRGHSATSSTKRSQQHSSVARSGSAIERQDEAPAKEEPPKFVLTLKTSTEIHETMTAFRKKYFPPGRNKLQAHVTLFHALTDLDIIKKDLTNVCRFTSPFPLTTCPPQLRGTFILVKMDQGHLETCSLRGFLRDKWSKDFQMTNQDLQVSKLEPRSNRNASWEAHWTIVNKEPDRERAKRSFEELQTELTEERGIAEGLSLWEYMDDGTWRHEKDWMFRGGSPIADEKKE